MKLPLGHRSTRRHEDVRPLVSLGRGLAVLAVIALAAFVLLRASSGLPFSKPYELSVDLPDAGSLRKDSPVEIGGVRVGRVITKTPTARGTARVEVQLSSAADPLPVDTTARVRAQGLLGARSLQLDPGSSRRMLETGDTIRGGSISNGVPEALRGFDARTRAAMGGTVRNLGRGLSGRGRQLNETLGIAPDVVADLEAIAGAVNNRPGAAERLLPSVRSGMTALDGAGEDMARAFDPAAEGLAPFIDRRADVRSTLDVAPGALSTADAGLEEGRRLLTSVRDLSAAASRTLPTAPTGLREVSALLRESRGPLRRADPLVAELGDSVPSVLRITSALDPLLTPLRRGLRTLRPLAVELGARRCDLDNFAENWRSMLGFGVRGGNAIGPMNSLRLEAIASNESLSGLGPGAQDVLLPEGAVSRNPYPATCEYSPGPPYNLDRLRGTPGR